MTWQNIFSYPYDYFTFIHNLYISYLVECIHYFATLKISNINHIPFSFQLEVKGTGWVSLALTERGSLMGSDIIIGWVAADQSATIIVSL